MPFIPHTDEDVREMLATIGAESIEALFDEIPASLRVSSLAEVPAGLSELEIMQLMAARARQDGQPLCFIGAGAYEHHIPAAVWSTVTRRRRGRAHGGARQPPFQDGAGADAARRASALSCRGAVHGR